MYKKFCPSPKNTFSHHSNWDLTLVVIWAIQCPISVTNATLPQPSQSAKCVLTNVRTHTAHFPDAQPAKLQKQANVNMRKVKRKGGPRLLHQNPTVRWQRKNITCKHPKKLWQINPLHHYSFLPHPLIQHSHTLNMRFLISAHKATHWSWCYCCSSNMLALLGP